MKITKKVHDAYWSCYRFVRDEIFEPVWYRFFGHKHHVIKTDLEPGPWIDTDTRMLHGVMSLVEWFVENDMRIWSEKEYEDECARIREDDEYFGSLKQMQDQYANDQKILSIYSWWQTYPNRVQDIKDATHEWYVYKSKFKKNEDDFICTCNVEQWMSEDEKRESQRLLEVSHALEEKLANEEQEMLKLAVELRGSMWS